MEKDKKEEEIVEYEFKKRTISEIANKKLYISYGLRVFVYIMLFILLLFLFYMLIKQSVIYTNNDKLAYIERGNTEYNVLLKNKNVLNGQIKQEYNTKDIDKVLVDYNYKFNSIDKVKGKFTYTIYGDIKVIDSISDEVYVTRTTKLTNDEVVKISNKKEMKYNTKVEVDYNEFLNVAKEIEKDYLNNSTYANLDLYLNVESSLSPNKTSVLTDNKSKLIMTIPLSDNKITIDNNIMDNTKKIDNKPDIIMINIVLILIGIILLLSAIIVFFKLNELVFHLKEKKSSYDIEVSKLLKQYDKLIVNVSILPDFDEFEINKLTEFKELIDAGANYNEPIRYMEITPHQKSYFFVKHGNELFLYTVKNLD